MHDTQTAGKPRGLLVARTSILIHAHPLQIKWGAAGHACRNLLSEGPRFMISLVQFMKCISFVRPCLGCRASATLRISRRPKGLATCRSQGGNSEPRSEDLKPRNHRHAFKNPEVLNHWSPNPHTDARRHSQCRAFRRRDFGGEAAPSKACECASLRS